MRHCHSSYFACRFQVRVEKSSTRPSFVFGKRYFSDSRQTLSRNASTFAAFFMSAALNTKSSAVTEVQKTAVRWRGVNGTELWSNASQRFKDLQRTEVFQFRISSSKNLVNTISAAQASNTSHFFSCALATKWHVVYKRMSLKVVVLNVVLHHQLQPKRHPFFDRPRYCKSRSTLLRSRLPWCSVDLFCPRQNKINEHQHKPSIPSHGACGEWFSDIVLPSLVALLWWFVMFWS